jgi:hypothetical protein
MSQFFTPVYQHSAPPSSVSEERNTEPYFGRENRERGRSRERSTSPLSSDSYESTETPSRTRQEEKPRKNKKTYNINDVQLSDEAKRIEEKNREVDELIKYAARQKIKKRIAKEKKRAVKTYARAERENNEILGQFAQQLENELNREKQATMRQVSRGIFQKRKGGIRSRNK